MRRRNIFNQIILILACGLWLSGYNLAAQQRPNPVVSPEVKEDNSVIFKLYAPEAKTVQVRGTFKDPIAMIDMVKNDTGLFEITLSLMAKPNL